MLTKNSQKIYNLFIICAICTKISEIVKKLTIFVKKFTNFVKKLSILLKNYQTLLNFSQFVKKLTNSVLFCQFPKIVKNR